MQEPNKLFGKRIKELRESKNFTQEKFAEIIEIQSRQLSRIETGKNFTTIDTLEKMAKALDVEIKDLFAFKHQKNKKLLISDIINMLDNTDEKNVKLIYKLVQAVLR